MIKTNKVRKMRLRKATFITVLDMRLPVGLAPVAPTRNSQTFAFGKVRFADYLHFFMMDFFMNTIIGYYSKNQIYVKIKVDPVRSF